MGGSGQLPGRRPAGGGGGRHSGPDQQQFSNNIHVFLFSGSGANSYARRSEQDTRSLRESGGERRLGCGFKGVGDYTVIRGIFFMKNIKIGSVLGSSSVSRDPEKTRFNSFYFQDY